MSCSHDRSPCDGSETMFPLTSEDLLADSFEAVVITDEDGRVAFWAPTAARLFGWPVESAQGQPLEDLLHLGVLDDSAPDANEFLASVRACDGTPLVCRVRRRRRNPDSTQLLYRFVDATSEHQTHRDIRAANARVSRITASMRDALVTVDFVCSVRFVNARAEGLLGVRSADAIGRRLFDAFPDLAIDQVVSAVTEAVDKRQKRSLDVHLVECRRYVELDLCPTPEGVAAYLHDITERVDAEQKARLQSEELARVLSELPVGVIRFDLSRRHLFVNRMAEIISGITREEHVGKTQRELGFPEDHCAMWDEAIDRVIEEGKTTSISFALKTAAGMRQLEGRLVPVRKSDGEVDSVVVIAQDITEQLSSEVMFRALFERSADAHFLIDEYKIVDANQAAVELLGYESRERLLLASPADLTPEYQHDGALSAARIAEVTQQLDTTGDCRLEWMFRRHDGSGALCEVHATQLLLAGRTVMLGVAYDISSRKEAEKRLRESEKRYRAIVENSSELIYSISLRGKVLFVSPSSVDRLGFEPSELVGRSLVELLHPEDAAKLGDYRRVLLRDGMPGNEIELRIRNRSGEYLHFSTSGAIVTSANGRPLYFVGAAQDVGEHIRLAQALGEARDAAEANLRAKSRFLAMVSHEIRTPLNGVLATADLILDTEMSEEQDLLVRTIRSSGETLLRVLNDVLDLSRVEAHRLPISLGATNLTSAVDEVVSLYQARAQHRGIELRAEWTGPKDILVLADMVRVKQVLGNLIHNALKFTHQGGITIRCELTPHDGSRCRFDLTVADTGIGIAPDRLEAVFDSFTQAEDATHATYGGTGLGLAICRLLTQAMGGTIWADSTLGQGSQFHIQLDFGIAPEDNRHAPAHHAGPIRAHILVADDNPVNAMITQRHLERIGCTVTVVGDGLQAVETASTNRFDAVFMDLMMPLMDGYEAARALRLAGQVDVPIIALTATANLEDHEACLEAGMNGFIPKPFTREQLAETLRRHLARR